ncbi:MAG TPA: sulfite exporter TauE/SafE family protein [Gaiellales bacterium]
MRRLAAMLAAAVALLALPATAQAHPLGNFTINRYSLIELRPGSVHVTFVLDIAEIPTFQALGGHPGEAGATRYVDQHAPGWASSLHLEVNGRTVILRPDVPAARASLRRGQGGLSILRVELPLAAALPKATTFRAAYRDDSFGDRLGWKEIVIRPQAGIVLTDSTAATHDVSHMLRSYPTGMLATPLDVRDARFSFRDGNGASIDVRAHGTGGVDTGTSLGGFTSLIERRDLTPGFVAIALLIAMFWGAVHALSPGHGKSLVGAYLVGSRGTARHAAFLGATVTITHTAGVFALGLVALYLSQYIVPETLYPWLAVISGLMVAGVGAGILRRRLRRRTAEHHHHHDGPGGHTHAPPGAITLRTLLALGVSGGLLPCPSALVVMLGAIALHRTAFGLVLVVAFSVGLAVTLTSVGLLVLYARRFVDRVPSSGRLVSLLPVASAILVTLLGAVLTVRGLDTFGAGPPRWLPAALAFAGATAAGLIVRDAIWPVAAPHGHAHGGHHHHHHDGDHHQGHAQDHELTAAEHGRHAVSQPS